MKELSEEEKKKILECIQTRIDLIYALEHKATQETETLISLYKKIKVQSKH